tara:strand:- start:304 stop:531 length:228 start_codon:yes stop_codon:yes gene_type:complete
MKVAIKPNVNTKASSSIKGYIRLREHEISFVDNKFYQKLFIVLISLSTILIIPESPKELEDICNNYNSRKLCNVW